MRSAPALSKLHAMLSLSDRLTVSIVADGFKLNKISVSLPMTILNLS